MNTTPDTAAPARRWWQPRAFEWGAIEMLIMRAGFAAVIFWNVRWETSPYKTQENPNGLARLFDLTWLAHHPPSAAVQGVVIGFLALYVIGLLPALGLLPVAIFAVLIGTLINSFGAINHSWQLVTLMALAQLIVYAWPRRGWRLLIRPDRERHRAAAWAALTVIAASYVVCGIVKLDRSDGKWLIQAPNLAVQVVKTHTARYYDTLQMPPEWLQKTTQFLLENPNIARVVFGTGLLIELAGFVLLINRRWAFVGGLAIIGMHLSISKLMELNFDAHLLVVLLFAVNLPGIAKLRRGKTNPQPA